MNFLIMLIVGGMAPRVLTRGEQRPAVVLAPWHLHHMGFACWSAQR